MSFRRILTALVLTCTALPALAQLYVIGSTNANALAQKLVGPGVTISNVQFSGSSLSSGIFYHLGGTNLNLDSGIVLSTGRAQTTTAFGLNGAASAFANTYLNFPGDADLDALVAPFETEDASYLEFDFVPLGDTVEFRYVFSSEEYPEFACSNYNDVFAFFISGPGIVGKRNLARIPGTNIPVAINSINDGLDSDPNGLCAGMGPGSPFSQYYVDNSTNTYFTHDGHTVVLTAAAAVIPCQTYHLKIAIADVGDDAYDSGVFLEAGSLRSDPVQISSALPTFNGRPYLVEGCTPGTVEIFRSKKESTPLTVTLAFGGNAVNGVDVQTLPTTVTIPANDSVISVPVIPIVDNVPEPDDSLKIYISSGCPVSGGNPYVDSIVILLRDHDTLAVTPQDTTVCSASPMQLTASGNFTTYEWFPTTGLSSATIANPLATPTTNTIYEVTANSGDCYAKGSVNLKVKSLQLLSKVDINCKNGTTGEIHVAGGLNWTAPVQYSINTQPYGQDSSFTGLPVGDYVVRVKDATGCVDSIELSLVQAYPDLAFSTTTVDASCNGTGGQLSIAGDGGLAPYTFSLDGTNYVSTPDFAVPGGTITVYVKDDNNCVVSEPVTVGTDPAITFTAVASPALCDGLPSGYVYITANGGSGNYEYSGDGINFDTPDSVLVSSSTVTITVRDDKGCSASNTINVPINDPVFVNVGNDTTICEGSTIQFATNYNGNSITWMPDPTLSATGIPDPVASPTSTTTYYVTVMREVCVAKDTITVEVRSAPVANAGPDTSICYGRTINLSGSGGVEYVWTPTTNLSDPTIASPSVKPPQTISYYLDVIDAYGCTSLKKDTVVVTVTPPIQAFAGNDTAITVGQALQLNGVDLGGSGVTTYEWSPATGLSDPFIANPIATLNQDMTYTLKMTTPDGCEGSDQITIKIYEGPAIYVPTGFTPNGDGRNDVLRPIAVGISQIKYFKVFNRWGQMVFSSTNPNLGWDGKISGVMQPTGTYVWVVEAIDFKGDKIFLKGVSTLIR